MFCFNVQDCPTRWGSMQKMIEWVLEQEKAIRIVLGANRKASHLLPTWQDIDVLTAINGAVSPLSAFTNVMSGEKYVTGSAVLPIVDLLSNCVLKENEGKSLTNDIRQKIIADLSTRNTNPAVIQLLEVSSFIDPRFKEKYIQIEDFETVKEVVCDDGAEIYASTSTSSHVTHVPQSSSIADGPPAKKTCTLGSLFKSNDSDFTDSPTAISPEQKVKFEVSMYLKEPRLDAEEDPLKWWKGHEEIYPILSKVAKKYLSVPATSTASERLFSKSGKIVTPTRASLKPEKVEMLVFLAKNV